MASRAMGFCLFNNIAVAAEHARAQHELERVLIVDWDVHHGNGTQDIFYEDGGVGFLSVHRSPFYPGTGAADETGAGDGLGSTLNVPLKFGISRTGYRDAFRQALQLMAERCRPELVLISAGFDAHTDDPIGSLGLESEDFATLTQDVLDVANTHSRGRVVSLLEGGYDLTALAESVEIHLAALLQGAGMTTSRTGRNPFWVLLVASAAGFCIAVSAYVVAGFGNRAGAAQSVFQSVWSVADDRTGDLHHAARWTGTDGRSPSDAASGREQPAESDATERHAGA